LISLQARIRQRVEHMSAEEARSAVLVQAREALRNRNFSRAVEILEQCRPPVLTPEIAELLEFARKESRQEELRRVVALACADGQTLMHEERYQDLVDLLTPIARESDDPRLRAMLNEGQRALEQRRAELAAALDWVRPFAEAGCYEQLARVIESLPASVSGSAEVQALLRSSQAARIEEWAGLEKLGRAYAALQSGDLEAIQLDADEVGDSTLPQRMGKMLFSRRQVAVDQILIGQVKQIQETTAAGGQIDAARQLADNRRLLAFASDAVKAEWSALANQYGGEKKSDGFFSRMGRRGA
jgi:hypothetical protein